MTIRLLSEDGIPLWRQPVFVYSDRESDHLENQTLLTDGGGYAYTSMYSSEPGVSTIHAVALSENVSLANHATVTFTTYEPPGSEFLFRLSQLKNISTHAIEQLNGNAFSIALQGDYFRGYIGVEEAVLTVNLLLNFLDFLGTVPNLNSVGTTQIANPGASVPGILNVSQASHPFAYRVLSFIRPNPEDAFNPLFARVLDSRNARVFAAFFGELTSDAGDTLSQEVMERLIVNEEASLATVSGSILEDTAEDLIIVLEEETEDLLTHLPSLTQREQEAYTLDLNKRMLANQFLATQLQGDLLTLQSFREIHEEAHDFSGTQLLLRLSAKVLAKLMDGWGNVAINGSLTLFDAYLDREQLSDTLQMNAHAITSFWTTPQLMAEIAWNTRSGLQRIKNGLPAEPVLGNIGSIQHYSRGRGIFGTSFWAERESWTQFSIENTGATAANYRIYARYLADTSRLGVVPWATMFMVAETSTEVEPGHFAFVDLYYLRDEGRYGVSPNSGTNVTFYVLGTNETGTFYVDTAEMNWDPIQFPTADLSQDAVEGNAPVISPPIQTYVTDIPPIREQEITLFLLNPFTTTMPVTITQPIFEDLEITNAPQGNVTAQEITWSRDLTPLSQDILTFTARYNAIPGTSHSLPPAVMEALNPFDESIEVLASNPDTITSLWP
ncbi:MAG TPA: hypothetical protein P5280_11360, partial [Cyclobacteriaceae bacterium]|nr:hypothetical protein [Cyclobacteriaceae bacterium]